MLLGFDIGGTKCAVITGKEINGGIEIINKVKLPTDTQHLTDQLINTADELLNGQKPDGIGISCGGPLDSENGVIISPPHLRKIHGLHITKVFEDHYNVSAYLENDANACALAEWKYGAGRGSSNMVFLTFGTGLGAGLILGGRLYSGANGMAGEAGHIRLSPFGPSGYGKSGSFEGFCSGQGIAQLGYTLAIEKMQTGEKPSYVKDEPSKDDITAETVADAALHGDETALKVFEICGDALGRGLSVIIDILNPEKIVIGSVFARCEKLLRPHMERAMKTETISRSLDVCSVLPWGLGENSGDIAALVLAQSAAETAR